MLFLWIRTIISDYSSSSFDFPSVMFSSCAGSDSTVEVGSVAAGVVLETSADSSVPDFGAASSEEVTAGWAASLSFNLLISASAELSLDPVPF